MPQIQEESGYFQGIFTHMPKSTCNSGFLLRNREGFGHCAQIFLYMPCMNLKKISTTGAPKILKFLRILDLLFAYGAGSKKTDSEDAVNIGFHKHSPCRQVRKLMLTHCRGIRRMHLRTNVSACVRAPGSHIRLICAWLIATRQLLICREEKV